MRASITAVLLAAAAVATAGIEHTILHGVSVGRVGFSMSPDQVPGLSKDEAIALMKSRLQKAHISVTPGNGAMLSLNATVIYKNSPMCFFRLDGQLVEEATLDRNGLPVLADSWQGGGTVGAATPADCAQSLRTAIDRAMDDFIEMHTAMNPKP
jgi:hypothetical protein